MEAKAVRVFRGFGGRKNFSRDGESLLAGGKHKSGGALKFLPGNRDYNRGSGLATGRKNGFKNGDRELCREAADGGSQNGKFHCCNPCILGKHSALIALPGKFWSNRGQ
jgi:hypothetical protein